jgi:hypothetical protein
VPAARDEVPTEGSSCSWRMPGARPAQTFREEITVGLPALVLRAETAKPAHEGQGGLTLGRSGPRGRGRRLTYSLFPPGWISGDDMIVRWESFIDRGEAVAAAGLQPDQPG